MISSSFVPNETKDIGVPNEAESLRKGKNGRRNGPVNASYSDRHEIDVRHLTAKLLAPFFIGPAVRIAIE